MPNDGFPQGYRLTKARKIRLTIARTLYFELLDGLGANDPKLRDAVWRRIDSELTGAGVTRDVLANNDEEEASS